MANKIIVFTLNRCVHCNELKKQLIKENIDFTELEIDENKKIWNSVVEQTGHNSLPTVFVGLNGEDEEPEVPAAPEEPEEPDVPEEPEVPSPPDAPDKLTDHKEYEPLPVAVVILATIAPVVEL